MINNWNSIFELPPPMNERVLLSDGSEIFIGRCFDDLDNDYLFALDDAEDLRASSTIVFWMPLPVIPRL